MFLIRWGWWPCGKMKTEEGSHLQARESPLQEPDWPALVQDTADYRVKLHCCVSCSPCGVVLRQPSVLDSICGFSHRTPLWRWVSSYEDESQAMSSGLEWQQRKATLNQSSSRSSQAKPSRLPTCSCTFSSGLPACKLTTFLLFLDLYFTHSLKQIQ